MTINNNRAKAQLETARDILTALQETEPAQKSDLIEIIGLAKEITKQAKFVVGHYETAATSFAEQIGAIEHDGNIGHVKNESHKTRTDWDIALSWIVARIADRRKVDIETGEVERLEETLCRELPKVIALTPSTKPKSAGMKDLGLDPYQFTSSEWRKKFVIEPTTN